MTTTRILHLPRKRKRRNGNSPNHPYASMIVRASFLLVLLGRSEGFSTSNSRRRGVFAESYILHRETSFDPVPDRQTHHRLYQSSSTTNGEWDKSQPDRTDQAIRDLMKQYDPILLFVSNLLPPDKARDASALYAWCRRLDEICDNEETSKEPELVRAELDAWKSRFDDLWTTVPSITTDGGLATSTTSNNYSRDDYLMDLALKECIQRYQVTSSGDESSSLLTRKPFDDMIAGMQSDAVDDRRIQTMDELELYAYRVAGTVGLMLLPLLLTDSGVFDTQTYEAVETAKDPAICLGKAIQLVNILRDATQDAKLGRIYLPQDLLLEEGVTEDDQIDLLLAVCLNIQKPAPDGYKRVVRKVSDRAHQFLAIAENGRSALPAPFGPLLVQIIVELYRDYLEELNRRGYDNLTAGKGDRVKISMPRKIQASLRAITKVFA